MRILNIYLVRELFKMVIYMIFFFIFLYTIFDFLEKANNFNEASIPMIGIILFFILQLPEVISLMIPVSLLIATIITLGLMNQRNEILAIKASGISILRFSLPILFIGLALSIMTALLSETIIPKTKAKTNYIWNTLVEKQSDHFIQNKRIWFKGYNSIYQIGFYDPVTYSLIDIVYYQFDHNFKLVTRIDARRACFLNESWLFSSGLYQERINDVVYNVEPFEKRWINLPERPSDFNRLLKSGEEMNFNELARYMKKIKEAGYDNQICQVDLYNKISFPFVTFILVFSGISFALFKKYSHWGNSLALSTVCALAYALLYWISFSCLRSLFGYSGIVPAMVSAWIPNVIFFFAGLYFFSYIR